MDTLQRLEEMSDTKYSTFLRFTTGFFKDSKHLWQWHPHGVHQLIIWQSRWLAILQSIHDNISHKQFYATRAAVLEHFWWLHVNEDIVWFMHTCHICQIQQTQKVLIPPVITMPAPLFGKVFINAMHLPASARKKYIVQGCCSLSTWPKFCALVKENTTALGNWIFQDIICWWGALYKIITDNGPTLIKALAHLSKCYHINHIHISGYNSHANGIIEQSHFDVQQAFIKVTDGIEAKWFHSLYSVFWAECITIQKCLGVSPYYITTGTQPLIPLDIIEATYLNTLPESVLSVTDLIARCAWALQKWPCT
jgi:Integrase zinc binding domain